MGGDSSVSTSAARFPIAFDSWYAVLSTTLFLPPAGAYVEIRDDDVTVRMGWAFSARFKRSSVASAERFEGAPLSRGVHGFAGRWLVNGSGRNILAIRLSPGQRARVMGVPVRLSELLVSVDDWEGLVRSVRI